MKNLSKRIATIAATLALVVVLGVTLAACGGSGSSGLGGYAERLANYNYHVEVSRNFTYVSETNGDKEYNYVNLDGTPIINLALEGDSLDWAIKAYSNAEKYKMVMIIKANNKSVAEKIAAYGDDEKNEWKAETAEKVEELKSSIENYKAQIAENKEKLATAADEDKATLQAEIDEWQAIIDGKEANIAIINAYEVVRDGTVIFYGHPDAIKIAR